MVTRFKYFILLFFSFLSKHVFNQNIANYVTNGSFEERYSCTGLNMINLCKGWRSIDSSFYSGVYYASVCFSNVPKDAGSYQWPKKGQSYGDGTLLCQPPSCSIENNRGYFRNRLKDKLLQGVTYCVKFFVNIENYSSYGVDAVGAFFGDDNLDTIKKISIPLTFLSPQVQNPSGNLITDTLNWVPITGTFIAIGIEKHLVVGNFKDDNATNKILINSQSLPIIGSDFFLDYVSCIPIDLQAYAGPNKNCIIGDSVFIGREPDVEIDESCIWYRLNSNGTLSAPIDTIAGLYIKPAFTSASTESYVVRQQLWCSGVKYDTVLIYKDFVGIIELNVEKYGFKFYPNPAANKLKFDFRDELKVEKISLINLLGQASLVIIEPKKEIDISFLSAGLYYLRVETDKGSKTFKLQKE